MRSLRDPEVASHVPLDLFASVRSTALVALATASLASPIVIKGDALASVVGGGGKKPVPVEQVVAGGIEFEMPATWGRLGSSAAGSDGASRVGTVVTALCPGGGSGLECKDGVQLTFVAYSGEDGHALPMLTDFEVDLDKKLGREFRGFKKGDAKLLPGADGTRYLDYPFTWGEGGKVHHQRFAAYRLVDGSGVVAIVTGDRFEDHAKAIDRFLESAHEPVGDAATEDAAAPAAH